MKFVHNIKPLTSRRKELRNKSTPEEILLWLQLKNSKTGFKFRRQHSFDYYILDFYCPEKHLCIELDGSPHDTEQGYLKDYKRTEYLQSKGITVLRFENKDVIKNLEGVLAEIKKYFN